jgi:MYXO-CTERM domain-containing protein
MLLTPRAASAAQTVNLYVAWMKGSGESNAAEYTQFIDCLIGQSSYVDFWSGQVQIAFHGVFVVTPPSTPVDFNGVSTWVASLIPGELPVPAADAVYLVIADPSEYVGIPTACGENGPGSISGVPINVGRVKTACWSGTSIMRNVTEVGMHELAEAIDGSLGKFRNCGDAPCYGLACDGTAVCSNITGLSCPGAPASTTTGCGPAVQGWVVQKLSHEGSSSSATCGLTCDFTVTARPADAGPPDPCLGTSDGYYCGQSPQWGGGVPNDLYDCKGGLTASQVSCPGGCVVEPAGKPDQCAPYDGGGVPDASSSGGDAVAPPAGDDATAPAAPDGGTSNAPVPPANEGGADAEAPASAKSGCSCATTGLEPTAGFPAAAVAFGLVVGWRLRRRRASRSHTVIR